MTISPPSEIKGARIYLKKPNLSFQEADQLFHVAQRNQDHLLPWLAWAQKTNKPEDSFLFLTQMNTLWKEEKRFEYLIYEMSTHDLIGGIGAAHSDSSRPHKIE